MFAIVFARQQSEEGVDAGSGEGAGPSVAKINEKIRIEMKIEKEK